MNRKTISYPVMSCLQVEGVLQEIILDLANLILTLASIILSIQFPIPWWTEFVKQLLDRFLYPVIAFISLFNHLVLINANLDADRS